MFFYSCQCLPGEEELEKEDSVFDPGSSNAVGLVSELADQYDQTHSKTLFCFVSGVRKGRLQLGMISVDPVNAEETFTEFLKAISIDVSTKKVEEITLRQVGRLLAHAAMENFVEDDDEILEAFGLDWTDTAGRYVMSEKILKDSTEEELRKEAGNVLCGVSLKEEMDRIFQGKQKSAVDGHPVHYAVTTDHTGEVIRMTNLLLNSLFLNHRLASRRVTWIGLDDQHAIPTSLLSDLYRTSVGGTIVIRLEDLSFDETEYASGARFYAGKIGALMKKYQHRVLTILTCTKQNAGILNLIGEYLGSVSLVHISEELVAKDKVQEYLTLSAQEKGLEPDESLFKRLDENKLYYTDEVQDILNRWIDEKVKTEAYPQYRNFRAAEEKVQKATPKGNAYGELMKMIGLDEVKKVIGKALNFYKAQKLFHDRGLCEDKPSMHMVFTGNPGTAKTTVARLFAEIMKENGLLKNGTFLEVGRGDLVGKFVGWTAQNIQEKFKEAAGGVLFIDEAYSLLDDKAGMFGDEAINTIVQEMENHRDDVVVIFAGYPEPMEKFLSRNPGLRSRIAFHVSFSDYSPAELLSIADLMTEKEKMTLDENAREKLLSVFESATQSEDFGNGRYVRNIVEQARMTQASRLVAMDLDSVTDKDICTILPEDIEAPEVKTKTLRRKMGFIA